MGDEEGKRNRGYFGVWGLGGVLGIGMVVEDFFGIGVEVFEVVG